MSMLKNNWFAAVCLALAVVIIGFTVRKPADAQSESSPPARVTKPSAEIADLLPGERQTIQLFERTSRSVVHIQNAQLRRDFFSLNVTRIPAGSGTGFVWDKKGHIITNFHVIQAADSREVILADQSRWPAEVVGTEEDKDVAVLRIKAPAEKLSPIQVGSSANLLVGQKVLAIGNPFGLDQTLTTGIISGLDREFDALSGRVIKGVIQTDAAINPGNSGGPLLDSSGRVIGINTAIYSPSGAYAGVGFSVPIDAVSRIIPQLITHGKIIRPVLGIALAPDLVMEGKEGVLILKVFAGTGAAKAGLRPTVANRYRGLVQLGDVIVEAGGVEINDSDDLYDALERRQVGDTIKVIVLRDNQRMEFDVTLSASD